MKQLFPVYKKRKKLYWVSTQNKAEDWFIVADDVQSACAFHEGFEGFLPGDAKAREICEVEKQYEEKEVYHAQLYMLEDMGFKVISDGHTRIVMKDGKTFREGTTSDLVIKEYTDKKEGLYILRINGTNKYKIGITKNFNKRLLNLQTGNPHVIDVWNFYPTQNSRKIEHLLHNQFKDKSIGGEWFELAKEDLDRLHKIVHLLTGTNRLLSNIDLLKEMFH